MQSKYRCLLRLLAAEPHLVYIHVLEPQGQPWGAVCNSMACTHARLSAHFPGTRATTEGCWAWPHAAHGMCQATNIAPSLVMSDYLHEPYLPARGRYMSSYLHDALPARARRSASAGRACAARRAPAWPHPPSRSCWRRRRCCSAAWSRTSLASRCPMRRRRQPRRTRSGRAAMQGPVGRAFCQGVQVRLRAFQSRRTHARTLAQGPRTTGDQGSLPRPAVSARRRTRPAQGACSHPWRTCAATASAAAPADRTGRAPRRPRTACGLGRPSCACWAPRSWTRQRWAPRCSRRARHTLQQRLVADVLVQGPAWPP